MNTYLRTIHTRSDKHKHRFALAVSGGTTLLIFAVWAFVHFGVESAAAANADTRSQAPLTVESETAASQETASAITPFEALSGNISDGWNSVKTEISEVVENVRSGGASDYVAPDAETNGATGTLNSNGQ